jgi:hypothetical protein
VHVKVPAWAIFYAPIVAAIAGGVVSAAALTWATHNRPSAR